MKQKILIDDIELAITNLDKVFWPNENITKGDLIEYYYNISSYILPYLKDRPQSLNRFPNGITGNNFYQKNFIDPPSWAKTIYIEKTNYLMCQDKTTLIYLVNLGCIELNVWNSRVQYLNRPDYMVIDLDPLEISFDYVREAAIVLHEVLVKINMQSVCKTSGATGLHVYIPLGAKYDYGQVKLFAKIICSIIQKKLPKTTSIERSPSARRGKIYLDFLQNNPGKTLAAPYCVRPRPKAPVSTPLSWDELEYKIYPENFNIFNIFDRLNEKGDIFKKTIDKGIDLEKSLKLIEKMNV